jgi:uncharacterized protein YegP (UPF0339 family)
MLGDVPLGQARPLFAVPRVDTLVRGQMPGVQGCVFLDMAVFDSRVLRDVPRNGFLSFHPLVHHDGRPLWFSAYYTGPDATPRSGASVRNHIVTSRAARREHLRAGGGVDGNPHPVGAVRPEDVGGGLKAANGEIIATSEGYKTKASAKNGIESVQKNAPDATVVDLTE